MRMHLVGLFALGCQAGAPGGKTDRTGDGPDVPPSGDDSGPPGTSGDDEIEVLEGRPSTTAWRRSTVQSPGSATFTELFHHPASSDETEWVELHNPMVLDLDVSGWQLTGAVEWTFPVGTRIPAGGFMVVAADPSRLSVPAFGPWTGALANEDG